MRLPGHVGLLGVAMLCSIPARCVGAPAATPIPPPVPPRYERLKPLHRETQLTLAGKPNASIVVPDSGRYRMEAEQLRETIHELTGARLPVVLDSAPAAAVPLRGHLICLGNRSTNTTIGQLYDRFYTFLDLKNPGPGSSVVRTLHNPFGNGKNVVFVGGSDDAGVRAASERLCAALRPAPSGDGTLTLGWTMDIVLDSKVEMPTDVTKFRVWDASQGYKSSGFFGWNIISKRMAMYYMTGDESQAREFMRLALPDAETAAEIHRLDGERFRDPRNPLTAPYHYTGHTLVMLWDLIEESPIFTDAFRLQITNAFSRQLGTWAGEGSYKCSGPPGNRIYSRHPQWSAISLYVLGRYFQKDYPSPVWEQSMSAPRKFFEFLSGPHPPVVVNECSFWYNTLIAPVFTWMVLTGARDAIDNGYLRRLLLGQEVLATGEAPCWATRYTSITMLHKAAYLTGDGRWLHYRDRLKLPLNVFRLGQSFWPPPETKPVPPNDLLNKWSVVPMTEPVWKARGADIPQEQAFYYASYRDSVGVDGDFILLDGCYAQASRNPFHNFLLQMVRLNGRKLIDGYENQVHVRINGLAEPRARLNGALVQADTLGATAYATGGVPGAEWCGWQRSLLLRSRRYLLIADDFRFKRDAEDLLATVTWQPVGASWQAKRNRFEFANSGHDGRLAGWQLFSVRDNRCTAKPGYEALLTDVDHRGRVLLRADEPGSWLEMPFVLDEPMTGELFAEFLSYTNRGVVRFTLDGRPAGADFDHFRTGIVRLRASLGQHDLAAGKHRIRVAAVGKSAASTGCWIGFCGLALRPPSAADVLPLAYELVTSEPVVVTRSGSVSHMAWCAAAKKGQRHCLFHLLGNRPADAPAFECLGLTANSAALALPQPAVVFVDALGDTLTADIADIAGDHLAGRAVRGTLPGTSLFSIDRPADVDWDFGNGRLRLSLQEPATLAIRLSSQASPTLNGNPMGAREISLPAGRHTIAGAVPDPAHLGALRAMLADRLVSARARRAASTTTPTRYTAAPEMRVLATANLGAKIAQLVAVPLDGETHCAAASGSAIRLIDPAGKVVGRLDADAEVHCLRWWSEPQLLLAGCADEEVIAFELGGTRRWEFVSQLSEGFIASYWSKHAHPGVWGLHTGVFLNGASQCFVGSACTLEILDKHGALLRRLRVPWGPVSGFALLPQADGGVDLLMGREISGTPGLKRLNSKNMKLATAFHGTAPGHTNVGGWMVINRPHILPADIDGDGTPEVVSSFNGAWNRVTVFTNHGKAVANAQFGPGAKSRFQPTINDMAIVDLDGDGDREIVVALSYGMLVVLDHQCRPVWSKRMPHPPLLVRGMPTPNGTARLAVACANGNVDVLGPTGDPLQTTCVSGRPTCLHLQLGASGVRMTIGTAKGQLKVCAIR